jgi:pimeloyl-ACP methyl ester carboxylesterase
MAVATFVFLPGAGSDSWYWHLVEHEVRAAGHDVVAVDLPVDDEASGLAQYTATAINAIGERTELALVAQSMGAFTAPLVASQVPVDLIVLVAGMVPAPGESAGEWWSNTGQPEAMREQAIRDGRPADREFDPAEMFLHDVPAAIAAESAAHARDQSGKPFEERWPLDSWPEVPTRFVLCRQDRLFPAAFQRRVVRERLGVIPDEMDSGHLPALSHPRELAERLLAYRAEWEATNRT